MSIFLKRIMSCLEMDIAKKFECLALLSQQFRIRLSEFVSENISHSKCKSYKTNPQIGAIILFKKYNRHANVLNLHLKTNCYFKWLSNADRSMPNYSNWQHRGWKQYISVQVALYSYFWLSFEQNGSKIEQNFFQFLYRKNWSKQSFISFFDFSQHPD